MILSRPELKERIVSGMVIRPDGLEVTVDHASIGLHLGSRFLQYKSVSEPIRLPSSLPTESIQLETNSTLEFPPNARLLASSYEQVNIPLDLIGFIQTKGTIARGFVMVHLCDAQIDPGFSGNITFELINLSGFCYQLSPKMEIASLFLNQLTSEVRDGYRGRYQYADGPTSMRVSDV